MNTFLNFMQSENGGYIIVLILGCIGAAFAYFWTKPGSAAGPVPGKKIGWAGPNNYGNYDGKILVGSKPIGWVDGQAYEPTEYERIHQKLQAAKSQPKVASHKERKESNESSDSEINRDILSALKTLPEVLESLNNTLKDLNNEDQDDEDNEEEDDEDNEEEDEEETLVEKLLGKFTQAILDGGSSPIEPGEQKYNPFSWSHSPNLGPNIGLCNLPKRDPKPIYRQVKRQYWHQKEIAKDFSGEEIFFRELDSNVRVSNMEAAGIIPVRKSWKIENITLRFPMSTDSKEIHKFLDETVLVLTVDGRSPLSYIYPKSVADGEAVFDIGSLEVGAGSAFYVSLKAKKPLTLSSSLPVTIVLDLLVQEPIY